MLRFGAGSLSKLPLTSMLIKSKISLSAKNINGSKRSYLEMINRIIIKSKTKKITIYQISLNISLN